MQYRHRSAKRSPGRPCLAKEYAIGAKREAGLRLARFNLRPVTARQDSPWAPIGGCAGTVEATVVRWMLNRHIVRNLPGGVELTRLGWSLLASVDRQRRLAQREPVVDERGEPYVPVIRRHLRRPRPKAMLQSP